MANVLVVAEHLDGAIRKATRSALTAARELAQRTHGTVHVALVGHEVGPLAEDLKAYGGTVHVADAPVLKYYLAESWAPVIANIAQAAQATYLCAGATTFSKDLLPRVAAQIGAAMASDVLGFGGDGPDVTFQRFMWAGNILADVVLETPIKAFTIRSTEFLPAQKEGTAGSVKSMIVDIDASKLRTRFVAFRRVRGERPELTDARIVVAGGRGAKGAFKEIEALADDLGAAVGATRAAVDAGWVPHDWQVGQTGKIVAPDLYIAAGISGAIQHVAGMKSSKVVVAINKDTEAPIFEIADYGLVADLFKAIPELRAKLNAKQ